MGAAKTIGRAAIAFAVLSLAIFCTISAKADDAQSLIAEGIELRRVGQDADALPKFERGYKLAPSPRAAAQLGLCYQALGRWSEAEHFLSEALKARQDKWVSKNPQILKDSLEALKPNVARVEVHGGPAGATVVVNGQRLGELPLQGSVVVNGGNVDIEVSKAGFERHVRSLQIPGGQYQRVLVRLSPSAEPTLSSKASEEKPGTSSAATLPGPPMTNTDSHDQGLPGVSESALPAAPIYRRPWFWVAIGGLVAAGAVGFVLLSNGSAGGPRVDDSGIYGAAP